MDDLLTNPHKASGTTTKNEEDLDYLIEYDSRTSFSSTSQENEASGEIEYDASSVISSTQKEGAGVVSPSEIEYNDGSQFSSTQKGAAVSQTKLYTQKFEIIERLFQTQTSGPKHGELSITFDTIDEFRSVIWNEIKHLLKKEVIIENDNDPIFNELSPIVEDFDKFIMFAHPTKKAAKAPTSINQISTWKNKVMRLYVHPYSTSLSNKSVFEKVTKSLLEPFEKDRAGACTNSHIETVIEKLKAIHGNRYQTFEINWRLWATYITNSETHLQDKILNEPPPPEIIRNFERRYNRSDAVLASNFQNLSVGIHINEDVRNELQVMKPMLDKLKDDMEQHMLDFHDFYNRFNRLEDATEARHGLLEAVPHQQPPRESDSSGALYANIEDCNDVDHN